MSGRRDPIADQMRTVRNQLGLSLEKAATRSGIPAVVIGSYERGDRQPTLPKARLWVESFGHQLLAVPSDAETAGGSPIRIEYAVRYGELCDGFIECDSIDEAAGIADHMPGAQVVHRIVHVGEWQVGQ